MELNLQMEEPTMTLVYRLMPCPSFFSLSITLKDHISYRVLRELEDLSARNALPLLIITCSDLQLFCQRTLHS